MEIVKRKYKRVVSSAQPDEYEDSLNCAYEELAQFNPTEETYVLGDALWTVLTWTETEHVPENAMDEYHLEGRRYVCEQCPLHAKVTDRRRKTVPCRHHEYGEANLRHECCEYFYTMLKQGKIKPIDERDLIPKMRKGRF